jgi:hypothetical protein
MKRLFLSGWHKPRGIIMINTPHAVAGIGNLLRIYDEPVKRRSAV